MLNVTRMSGTANLVLGAWLMISALFWRHSSAQAFNALVIGTIAVALAIETLRRSRFFEAGTIMLALWLFLSPIAIPGGTAAIVIHHFIVSTLLFGFAAPALAAPVEELEPGEA